MRFFTFLPGAETPVGVLSGPDSFVRLPFASLLELIAAGDAGIQAAREALERGPRMPLAGLRLAAPIPEPRRNIFCLGWNYSEHSKEASAARGRLEPPKLPTPPVAG